ncbi:MAG: LamG-like jellyroll fold domain-containing protein [Flavobacteriaceae bacterium]
MINIVSFCKRISICTLVFISVSATAQTVIISDNFNSGWGNWTSGGIDAFLASSNPLNATQVVNIQDDSGNASSIQSNTIDITPYGSVSLAFDFRLRSYRWNAKFEIQYSNNGGSTWQTISEIFRNSSHNNDTNYNEVHTIDINSYTFTNNVKFRIEGFDNDNNRDVFIDNIIVTGYPPVPEISITSNTFEILDGDTTPYAIDNTDYGSAALGTTMSRTFTIKNIGTSALTISSITLSNTTDFSIVGTPYTSPIPKNSSTTFTVRFNSLTTGIATTNVIIANSDSDENPYNFIIKAEATISFFDSDGDGVYDNIDIDDDNDGILDSVEELACQNSSISITANYKFLNETFGVGNRTTINTTYDAITTYCYEDGTASCPSLGGIDLNDGEYTVYYRAADGDGINDTPIEEVGSWADQFWYTGEDHTAGDTNGRMAMFNAAYDPGIFYTASITGALPNVPVTYSFWVINLDRTDAPDIANRLRPDILVEFRDVNDNVLASITTGDIPPTTAGNLAGDWYNFTANLTFNVSEFNVYFYNNQLGGLGNDLALDDIVISQTLCDTDNDGVADLFDLDADNDGIPDVVEAGLGDYSEGTATLTGVGSWIDANGNGMHDLVEGHIVLDTDGDGTPNFLDLDSDNDAIFDVDESGAGNSGNPTYQNGDGDINGDGVGDGPDSDDVRETDVNSDNTIEYYTDGILDIYDYFNGITFPTAYGNTNQGLGSTYYVIDTDSDGLPDYMDTTSDGSTYDISHTLYASLDGNNDGVIDGSGTVYPNGQIDDAEGDGILDAFDTSDTTFGSPRDLDRKLHLYFDGRNDYADDINVIDGWSEATMMVWIKIDPSATGTQIIAGQDEFYFQLNANKSVTANANGSTITTGTNLNTNQWYHIAATYSNADNIFRLYKNGLEIGSKAISGSLPSDASSFTIGKEPDTNSKYYHGYIDELRVFNKALSANEIQKMVYQEIENNSTIVRGAVIPRDITDFVNASTITPLNWSYLKRYFRMDIYKDDIIDDLTTPTIDFGSGARIYNTKIIDYQNAPLPFVTQSSGNLDAAVNIPADGVNGNDAALYDWSLLKLNTMMLLLTHIKVI